MFTEIQYNNLCYMFKFNHSKKKFSTYLLKVIPLHKIPKSQYYTNIDYISILKKLIVITIISSLFKVYTF